MQWRKIFGPVLGAAFICAAVAVIHYDEAIRPNLARLAQSARGVALTAYPPLREAARPSSSRSVKAAAARFSGTPNWRARSFR